MKKRDPFLGKRDYAFVTSERYFATCDPLLVKRDAHLGGGNHTFRTSERYFVAWDPLLVKRAPYFVICVSISAKRTTVWQKRDIECLKRVREKPKSVPEKGTF
ncbi:hypothetical protein H8B06_08870 [Sphingobacterium sp. DN00404]|uniref:Uncharacterized protein n=1 Tax=Sphingobacterium micropteri TaxID=2763501 RepID=A0ABR7YNM6_9SPHI|nr:hypothetical protein [Sphingobacterium micropteri]MBD1432935.1 hypothetical protein [Sphingobacterium micropteri]